MNNKAFNHLPKKIQKVNQFLKGSKIPSKVTFLIVSLMATAWFLIRVIPKPGRAAYPCMRIATPIMSSLIIWLISVTGSWLLFKKAKSKFREARYLIGIILLVLAFGFGLYSTTSNSTTAKANEVVTPWYKPNQPVGVARGINPGRVVWTHEPGTAQWDGTTGFWWEDQYTNQQSVDDLLNESLTELTGKTDRKEAWNSLFVYFNKTKKNEDHGYNAGEKVAVKINMNNTYSHEDNNEINTSPQMVLALLKTMVEDAGILQENITIFEASRFLTNNVFDKCFAAYPKVNYVDNAGGNGRTRTTYVEEALPYSEDNGRLARGLATCAVEANYLINVAVLKGHVGQGVTLCAKNYYGVTSIHADWRKNVHNNFDQDRNGNPKYMTFVDFMGHKDLGEKTMLFLVDGIYGNKFVDQVPAFKWQMKPFNNDWPSSIFASQDMVAIDAVCSDFILNEFPDAPDLKYCDAYLLEAAQANNPPSGTKYDPERDGTSLSSLGVMEHWNNPIDKKYSRNLKKGNGIELVYKKL